MAEPSDVSRIENEIAEARQRLDLNLEALTSRLRPAALAHETLNMGIDAANLVGRSLKRPRAVLGVAGVIVLMLAVRYSRARSNRTLVA